MNCLTLSLLLVALISFLNFGCGVKGPPLPPETAGAASVSAPQPAPSPTPTPAATPASKKKKTR